MRAAFQPRYVPLRWDKQRKRGYGFLNHRKTIASIQILNSDETARREMEDAARRAVQETGSAADNAAENSPENPAKP
jgi:hypothetical protein